MSNRTHPTDSTAPDADRTTDWTVRLPDSLGSRIDQRLPDTEFDSVEAYVHYVMESVLRELDEQDAPLDGTDHADHDDSDPGHDTSDSDHDSNDTNDGDTVDGDAGRTDTGSMEDRLEALGYL